MARKKKPAARHDHSQPAANGGLLIQLAALAVVIGLVVYLLIASFAENDQPSAGAASRSAANAQQEPQEELPPAPVTIDPPFVHFGEVPPNTMHTTQVTLTNNGTAPIRIIDTRPSCPCTKVQRNGNTINPGQSLTLGIEMDSESRIGPKSVSVNVMFRDYNLMRIPVSATVVDGPA
jgi:hypothetical protein